jgi:hypothetical protein
MLALSLVDNLFEQRLLARITTSDAYVHKRLLLNNAYYVQGEIRYYPGEQPHRGVV